MKSLSLAELQNQLQGFLLDQQEAGESITIETPRFSRAQRLAIYHEAYSLRLIDALQNDYPALRKMLGDDIFTRTMKTYIAQHPSQHPSLRWLGQHLPEFLRESETKSNAVAMYELADFEWKQTMAFDAADTAAVTIDDVRALDPTRWMTMQLQFHPSVYVADYFSNAPAYWSSAINDETTIASEIGEAPQAWLIWRDDLQVMYRPIAPAERWALSAFLNQSHFADVCEGLCEWFNAEQVPLQTAQFLQHWINAGMITHIIANSD